MKTYMRVVTAVALFGAVFAQAAFAEAKGDANAEAFKALDVDGDGVVTMQEAEPNEGVANEFADADINGDGVLNMEEFAKLEVGEE